MIRVTVVIPVFNEEATIVEIVERVGAQSVAGVSFEVIVVDDGSTDGTGALLEQRPELYRRLIRLPANGGKGAAVKAALAEADGDFVLFQDADLEYDPGEYVRLLRPVVEFDADVVIGSRFLSPEFTRVHYFWHKIGNRFITFVFNLLNNTTFTDIYSCYLLYRRTLVDPSHLVSLGWEQHAEILSRAVVNARHLYEVPISYRGRGYEEGKKIKAYHAIAVIWMIVRRRFLR